MGSPKHLWSGDWEHESAAAAARRAAAAPPAEPAPAASETDAVPGPEAPRRTWTTGLRRRRTAFDVRRWAVAAGVVLLLAVVVGTAAAVLGHGGSSRSTSSPATVAPRTATTPQGSPGMGQPLPGTVLPYSQGSGSAWLGVTLERSASSGAVVDGIVAGGPADQGGLRPDDVILAIDNHSVASPQAVINLVGSLNAGQTVSVRVQRGSSTFTIQVTLGARSSSYSTP